MHLMTKASGRRKDLQSACSMKYIRQKKRRQHRWSRAKQSSRWYSSPLLSASLSLSASSSSSSVPSWIDVNFTSSVLRRMPSSALMTPSSMRSARADRPACSCRSVVVFCGVFWNGRRRSAPTVLAAGAGAVAAVGCCGCSAGWLLACWLPAGGWASPSRARIYCEPF